MPRSADEVRAELLAEWLLVNGLAEEERGYGHVSAEDLAAALLERYRISLRHNDGYQDREPLPTDGPEYHADHAAWVERQKRRNDGTE